MRENEELLREKLKKLEEEIELQKKIIRIKNRTILRLIDYFICKK